MSAYLRSDSATAVFRTTFAPDMEVDEPSIRNSNLLPVKAKGEVRLRSVASRANLGRTWTPTFICSFSLPP